MVCKTELYAWFIVYYIFEGVENEYSFVFRKGGIPNDVFMIRNQERRMKEGEFRFGYSKLQMACLISLN